MRHEDQSIVRDNRFRDVIQANDIIEEQTCELSRVDSFETRNKITHLHEVVDEDNKRIIPICKR